jgi:hypothetical protein
LADKEKGDESAPLSADSAREIGTINAVQWRGFTSAAVAQAVSAEPWRRIELDGFEKRSGFDDIVKICCISSPFKIEEMGPVEREPDFKLEAEDELCVTQFAGDYETWCADRLTELDAALKLDPDIVSFSELAYPPINDRTGQPTSDQGFIEQALKVLEQHNSSAFVFFGSHHTHNKQNVGVIFPFGQNKFNISDEPQTHITYVKRAPTRSIGELVDIPDGEPPPAIERPEGYVTVLMSAEVLEIARTGKIALRNLNHSGGHTGIDLIVVPSFATDKNEPIDTMCRYLSRWTATTVVHVNANRLSDGFPKTAVFVCGKQYTQAQHPRIMQVEDEQTIALRGGASSTLHIFKLNRELVDVERRKWLASAEMRRFMVPVSIEGAKLTRGGAMSV